MYLRYTITCLLVVGVAFLADSVHALPTQMVHVDTPQCDPLFIPNDVHEIGDAAIFPGDESLISGNQGQTQFIPCPLTNQTNLPEVLVEMRNLSGRPWLEVWYVADQETTITNFDGEANDASFPPLQEAFRIDNDISDPGGSHHPLVFESGTPDGIWEPLESWIFVLQDYTNSLGLPPEAFTSLGVGSASIGAGAGLINSSGSIIGITIPEPTTAMLLLLGCIGITRKR